MPIGTVGNPFYNDFMNPANSPVTQTKLAVAKLREIQKSSSRSDFNGKFGRFLNQPAQDMGIAQFFAGGCVLLPTKRRK